MVKIKFKAQGANSVLGSFSAGDVAMVGEDFARHLVEELKVADYASPAPAVDAAAKPEKPRRSKAAVLPAPTIGAGD